MNDLRPEVQWFARQMEAKLKVNDHKKHWSQVHQDYLIHRLYQEAKELWVAIKNGTAMDIIQEAADVANFAMMIADNAENNSKTIAPENDPNQMDMFEYFKLPIDSNIGD